MTLKSAGGAVSRRASQRPRSKSSLRGATFRSSKFGGLEVSRFPCMSKTCLPCCAGPRIRAIAWPASASCNCCRGVGPATAAKVLDEIARAGAGALSAIRPGLWPRSGRLGGPRARRSRRRPRAGGLASVRQADVERVRGGRRRVARRVRDGAALVRAASRAQSTKTPRFAMPTCCRWRSIAGTYASRERFLTELTLDPPRRHQRRIGRAAHRRRLSDPVHHPFGEGAGVAQRVRAEWCRRLHSVRPRHGQRRPKSTRSAACSMWR